MSYSHMDAMHQNFDLSILTGAEIYLLLLLCRYANSDNECWPSAETLAQRAGRTKKKIYETLSNLQKKNIIKIGDRVGSRLQKIGRKFILLESPLEGVVVPDKGTPFDVLVPSTGTPYIGIKKDNKRKKDIRKKPLTKKDEEKMKIKNKNPYVGKSANEILQGDISTPVEEKKRMGPRYLSAIWKESYADAYPGNFISDLSVKDLGYLGIFIKRTTEEHAETALRVAITDWNKFTKFCEGHGAFNTPTYPTLWFLVKFAGQSVNFAKEQYMINIKSEPKNKITEDEDGLIDTGYHGK